MKTTPDLAKLNAFFSKADIKFRLGATTKDKLKGQAFAYISARAIQNRLDDIVGPANWRDSYEMIGATSVLCTLAIRVGNEWVEKQDVSEIADQKNGFKGGVSDALKRAAVKWGIGRYLYEYEPAWVTLDNGRLPKTIALPDEFLVDEEKAKKASKPALAKKDPAQEAFNTKMTSVQGDIAGFSADDKKFIQTIFEKVMLSDAKKPEVIAWLDKDAVSSGKLTEPAKDWLVAQIKAMS